LSADDVGAPVWRHRGIRPRRRGSDPTWDLSDGIALEIQFPLLAGLPLAGYGVTPCHCLKALTKVLDAESNPVLMSFIDLVATAAAVAAPVTPPPAATPPPPPPPPPAAAAADTTPPASNLTGASSQKLGKTVAVSISCSDEACKATASGTVLVPKAGRIKAKTYKLAALTKSIAKGAKATARLKLNATPRAAIKRALKRGKRVVVKFTVRIADASGNTRTLTRQVKLKL